MWDRTGYLTTDTRTEQEWRRAVSVWVRGFGSSLTKMTDDVETKLGVDAAACDDEAFSISLEHIEVLRVCDTRSFTACEACNCKSSVKPVDTLQ